MKAKIQITAMEQRMLLAAGGAAIDSNGVLQVAGTKNADIIEIGRDPKSKKRVLVSINGKAFRFENKSFTQLNVDAGRGKDRIIDRGGWGAPQALAGETIESATPVVILGGGADDDTIETDSWSNHTPIVLDGGSGNDTLNSRGGGKFELLGGAGDDRIVASDGDDCLVGGDGDDVLYGGSGDDMVFSGTGDDFVEGGDGNDLWGDAPGYRDRTLIELYSKFPRPMRLSFDRKPNDGPIGEADNVRSVERITGSTGTDTIDASNSDAAITMVGASTFTGLDSVIGSRFDDHLIGSTVHGGAGNDTIKGCGSADSIFGDDGDDQIDSGSDGVGVVDHIEGGAGNDLIDGNLGSNYIDGGTGNDTLHGGGGRDTLIGYAGNDTIEVDFNQNVPARSHGIDVRGGSGKDKLIGHDDLDLTDGDSSGFEVIH